MNKPTTTGIVCILLLLGALECPAQTPQKKSGKTVVRVTQMDVIYSADEKDHEYGNIEIDQNDLDALSEESFYDSPILLPPPPSADPSEPFANIPMQPVEDEGAESEEEILYAGFDSETIHYPKLDVSQMTEAVNIALINKEKGEYFHYPTPVTARTSSHFGPRRRRFHYGLDLAQRKGEDIYAAFDGVVRISTYNRSYGNLIVIRHNNGLETYYAHLSQRNVTPGDKVKAGSVIGLCGNTGRSYGAHLHFEIRYMGNAINPENIINTETHELVSDNISLDRNSFRRSGKAVHQSKSGRKPKAEQSNNTYAKNGKQFYRVRSGDTLSKIASRNGTSVNKLLKLNGLREKSILRIGQQIRIR